MKAEINSLVQELENTLDGKPWFGRPVYSLLRETDPSIAFVKPAGNAHSLVELLYHMLTWAQFTLKRIEQEKTDDMQAFEKLDWREIDPQIHGWEEGLAEFIAVHQQIIAHLHTKDDSFLSQKVDYRDFDFRFLIKGLIQHNIYHLGQVAYVKKLL